MEYCIINQEGKIIREKIKTNEEAIRIRSDIRTNFNSLKILFKVEGE